MILSEATKWLELVRILELFGVAHSFYRLRARLNDHHGYQVNHKRVARLMLKMGLQAVYPRPRTSISDKQHKKYPY